MHLVNVPASRAASIRECRGSTMLLAAGVTLDLPLVVGDDFLITVKSMGAGCKVGSPNAGLEIGEGATSGSPAALTLTTSDVTLLPGEARTYAWSGSAPVGWICIGRSIPPSALRLGAEEPALIGTGDGTTTDFDLPVADVASVIVFVSGAAQLPAAYSITQGGGTGGVDLLVFGSAPAGSAPIVVWYARATAA